MQALGQDKAMLAPLHKHLELCNRHRPAEQIALIVVATQARQQFPLRLRLDPFGDHCQPQAVGQCDHHLGDGHVIGVSENVAHEALVNLEPVQRQAFQV